MDQMDQSAPDPALALARTLLQRGLKPAGLDLLYQLVISQPAYGDAWALIGGLTGDRAALQHALAVDPKNCEAMNDLAGLVDAAAAGLLLQRAIDLNPQHVKVRSNYGLLLQNRGHSHEALVHFTLCVILDPGMDQIWSNLATAAIGSGLSELGIQTASRALLINSDLAAAHYNLGMSHLMSGALIPGFAGHEWRFKAGAVPVRPFAGRVWQGEHEPGNTLLVHAEQGLGDSLLFSRFVAQARQRVGRIILLVQPELAKLFQQVEGADLILAYGTTLPAFDAHCPLMSLGHVLGTTIDTIPSPPTMVIDPAALTRFGARLKDLPGLKVGLVWQGNPAFPGDRTRSIPFATLAPLVKISGITWINLQKGASKAEADPAFNLIDWMDEIDDLTQTAALIKCLDLVIGVDTMLGHLTGTLGKPVWIMNRHNTCWRWFLNRSDSPWYSWLRLFRQSTPGVWNDVIDNVAAALEHHLAPVSSANHDLCTPETKC